ncbi:MAG: ArsR family transcriptional regulator [Patescibacteria group bacterium]
MRYKELISIFRTLAGRRRLEMINLLQDNKERSVSDISEKIRLSLRSTSKHLLQLLEQDLVESRRVNNLVLYRSATNLSDYLQKIIKEINKC